MTNWSRRPAVTEQGSTDTPEARDGENSGISRGAVLGLVGGVAAVLAAFILVMTLMGDGSDYEVVIPEGTGAAVDAGEDVDVVPAEIELSVGDTLVLINEDSRPHVVGPFTVMADDDYTHTFDSEQELVGECSAHPDRSVRITVT